MNGELEQPPDRLSGTKVASINVLLNLISPLSKLHVSTIMPFVSIFENIFDQTDVGNNLDIEMGVVLLQQRRGIRDHITVVHKALPLGEANAIIAAAVLRISIRS